MYAKGTTYYVDSIKGDDNLDGKSIKTAWKSINRINTETYAPGSRVLLKAGGEYQGSINPKGSGLPSTLNVIASYGKGPKPRINGVTLSNVECWEIRDMVNIADKCAQVEPLEDVEPRETDFGSAGVEQRVDDIG